MICIVLRLGAYRTLLFRWYWRVVWGEGGDWSCGEREVAQFVGMNNQVILQLNLIFCSCTKWKSFIQRTPIFSHTLGILILVELLAVIFSSFVTTVAFWFIACAIIQGSAIDLFLVLSTKFIWVGLCEYIFLRHAVTGSEILWTGILLDFSQLDNSSSVLVHWHLNSILFLDWSFIYLRF